MSGKPPRLVLSESVDLPVVEASGVTVRRTERGPVVLVVGDRTTEVGACLLGAGGELDEWSTIDLADLPGWPLPSGDSQFEAIAADGGSLVALMCEDPPLVLVADTVTRELRAQIELTAPNGSLLDGQWDDASSRGEGLVFLRGGRLLVAQEKRPRASDRVRAGRHRAAGRFERRSPRARRVVGRTQRSGRVRAAVDVEAEVCGQEGVG